MSGSNSESNLLPTLSPSSTESLIERMQDDLLITPMRDPDASPAISAILGQTSLATPMNFPHLNVCVYRAILGLTE